MPKAKPVSLHPLSVDEAIKALIRVDPKRGGLESKRQKDDKQRLTKRKTPKK